MISGLPLWSAGFPYPRSWDLLNGHDELRPKNTEHDSIPACEVSDTAFLMQGASFCRSQQGFHYVDSEELAKDSPVLVKYDRLTAMFANYCATAASCC